jgi:hypothetical protein
MSIDDARNKMYVHANRSTAPTWKAERMRTFGEARAGIGDMRAARLPASGEGKPGAAYRPATKHVLKKPLQGDSR